jgi:hypothetical protein
MPRAYGCGHGTALSITTLPGGLRFNIKAKFFAGNEAAGADAVGARAAWRSCLLAPELPATAGAAYYFGRSDGR